MALAALVHVARVSSEFLARVLQLRYVITFDNGN